MLGIARDGEQGFGGGAEQAGVDDRFVLEGNVGDDLRDGEDKSISTKICTTPPENSCSTTAANSATSLTTW